MNRTKPSDGPVVTVVGGGLAGSEAAYQIARRGVRVRLFEMRPQVMTPAHVSDRLGELVCSNSLGGDGGLSPAALLKAELRMAGSLVLEAAEAARVPGGQALVVDRERFAEAVTERLLAHPLVEVVREVVAEVPEPPAVIATGPLTAPPLAAALERLLGERALAFFDAASPVVFADSVDMTRAFWDSREGTGDYLNCPLTREEYERFVRELVAAEQHPLHEFEDVTFFEGCLPIEELARRGPRTPLFGPMRPVGLVDPATGRRPYAVVQLRRDNAAGSLLSLVGFQTNLRWGEQKRVFGLIPALAHAEYARYGVMHRNTYLRSPRFLDPDLSVRGRPGLWLAGQMTGVEGYVESAAGGLLAGINAVRWLRGQASLVLPADSMWGALMQYISRADPDHFQPMNTNFGLLPPAGRPGDDKRARRAAARERALAALAAALRQAGEEGDHERG
ncbi:tRNA:m(5)U-54 methyltransferase [Candidatus Hydrogenisulfobacillus filiaventi]|uniref:Methylenetetrahydrofolate--tRNA-(uracil-5-)-methyltransferase TrmFO n=1 Tax=Candidatus Hydrogenisulfobacillus filiaventi TaxID=2707344 RepID=A0A6F8ZHK1_9FIRM|nr:tRNA:m(5)U-54 methyltransferase [Candidatus Hydrogenisulfobacillus filiaventi]